jgi:hypothetical protein
MINEGFRFPRGTGDAGIDSPLMANAFMIDRRMAHSELLGPIEHLVMATALRLV